MSAKVIAVTGASGQLGKLIVKHLAAKASANFKTVALVRNPGKYTAPAGVEVRAFDYNNASTLADGIVGVSVLVLVSSSEIGQRYAQHKAVIDAAKAANVSTILYTSILRAPTSPIALKAEHQATEEYLAASGIQSVFLRNGWYVENWSASVGGAIAGGGVLGATKDALVSPATRNDFAEAAANAAIRSANGESLKTAYELGGISFKLSEYAAEVSKHAGKTIPYVDLPEEKYKEALQSFGIPEVVAALLSNADVGASQGGLFVDTTDIADLLGRQPEDWREFVKNAVLDSTKN
ncbi:hypothetical protein HDU84_004507 [Entophlyctis sp. JEL0112]|nr:hypothetical protein HDU84_004507 [Entophlyctis sp. JEL0112]